MGDDIVNRPFQFVEAWVGALFPAICKAVAAAEITAFGDLEKDAAAPLSVRITALAMSAAAG